MIRLMLLHGATFISARWRRSSPGASIRSAAFALIKFDQQDMGTGCVAIVHICCSHYPIISLDAQ